MAPLALGLLVPTITGSPAFLWHWRTVVSAVVASSCFCLVPVPPQPLPLSLSCSLRQGTILPSALQTIDHIQILATRTNLKPARQDLCSYYLSTASQWVRKFSAWAEERHTNPSFYPHSPLSSPKLSLHLKRKLLESFGKEFSSASWRVCRNMDPDFRGLE